MWQSFKTLNVFNTLALKQILWKTETCFKKLDYGFLVESTKMESTSFPYKTAISEDKWNGDNKIGFSQITEFCQ